ncbi:MAG: DUF3795 domain-containing protein [Bacilli bacterium]|nr:DUF3795 domain-containing protein [Bacilli bacterium]
MDNPFYAYCGLNCLECQARKATIDDDDELRKKVAKEWSELNKVEIKPEDINCVGCRIPGKHFAFCESMCPIRQCGIKKSPKGCVWCADKNECKKLEMVTSTNEKARENLHFSKEDE